MRYEDVDPDEAYDLVRTLPDGSLTAAALDPARAWGSAEQWSANVVDAVWALISLVATHTTEGAPRVTRPGDAERAERAHGRAEAARERIEKTEWEEAGLGD